MDFKAALVSNLQSFMPMDPSMNPCDLGQCPGINERQSGAPTTRRRRRRRNNAAKQLHGLAEVLQEQQSSQDPDSKPTENSAPPSTLDGPPSLRLLQASPSPLKWESENTEKVALDTLQLIATRARERLAIRIQAHWEEQQNVARAAAQIQASYAANMQSQLQAITRALQDQHSREIDARFAVHEKSWKDTFGTAIKELRAEAAQIRFRRSEAAHDSLRINALEAETRKMMEMITTHTCNKSGEDGPSDASTNEQITDPKLMDTVVQLQVQASAIQSRILNIHNSHDETTKALNEMQSAMVAAGLFSARYPTNQISKQSFPNYDSSQAIFHPPAFEVDQRSNRAPSQAPSSGMLAHKENEPPLGPATLSSPAKSKQKTEAFPGTPQKHSHTSSQSMRMGMGRSPSSVLSLSIGSPLGDSTNRL